MVTSINLPHLSISSSSSNNSSRTPSTSSLSTNRHNTITSPIKTTSPLTYSNLHQNESDLAKEGRALDRAISGETKRKSLGLTSTLNALLSRPNSSSANHPPPTTTISRPTSDNSSGLLPLRGLSLSTSSSSKQRSHSAAPTASRNNKSLGLTVSVPVLSTASSQPNSARPSSSSTTASVLKSFLPSSQPSSKPSSRLVSPVATPHGISTPLPNQSMGSRSSTPALHTLEESYVGKVTARLGEAVNKVFVMGPASGAGGAEWNKMNSPKYLRAREVGEMICSELNIAQHDTYLLRTLLRSSVLKSLSLFLSRLTTLLLPPTSYPTLDLKDIDNFPLPLRFNLEIVRSAYELKEGLRTASNESAQSFVGEILGPWIAKFEELMAKVMGPIVIGLRITVAQICAKAREEEVLGEQIPKISVGRSLSIGRAVAAVAITAEPTWIKDLAVTLEATGKLFSRLECGRDSEKWLVSIGTCAVWKGMLALSSRRLTGGETTEGGGSPQPSVSSTKSLFKPTSTITTSPTTNTTTSTKSSPSLSPSLALLPSGLSPKLDSKPLPLPTSPSFHPHSSHLTDLAFVRLLSDLELFESRLITFVASLHHPCPTPDILMSGKCQESLSCGLCKTGRTFDAESSSEDDEDGPGGDGGVELAQCAMREAMQALSAMVIVVRASSKTEVLKEALLFAAGGGIGAVSTTTTTNGTKVEVLVAQAQLQQQKEKEVDEVIKPMTPFDFLSIPLILENVVVSEKETQKEKEESKTVSLSSFPTTPTSACPTLAHALDTLPTLILLHLLISRLPVGLGFRFAYEIWELEYRDYAKELRGFAAAEEWLEEIGWELAGEVARVKDEKLGVQTGSEEREERERVRVLALAIRTKVNVDVVEV